MAALSRLASLPRLALFAPFALVAFVSFVLERHERCSPSRRHAFAKSYDHEKGIQPKGRTLVLEPK